MAKSKRIMTIRALREELEAEFEIIGTVTNGQDAVEAVRLFNPDVVVLDIAMPVLDGIGALERNWLGPVGRHHTSRD